MIDSIIAGPQRPMPQVLVEPFTYLEAIPGNNRNMRHRFLVAFNETFFAIANTALLEEIGAVIGIFHNASLLIDDIEDASTLRRGRPCAHLQFGVPLTINSGNLMYFVALQRAVALPGLLTPVATPASSADATGPTGPAVPIAASTVSASATDVSASASAVSAGSPLYTDHAAHGLDGLDGLDGLRGKTASVLVDEMLNLHHGQGLDIYWRDNLHLIRADLPAVDDYLRMVMNKTGGLFRLLVRLLGLFADKSFRGDLLPLANLLGIIYQIRDDYLNLVDQRYSEMKGVAGEDLVEGKLSLPVLHTLLHFEDSPVHRVLFDVDSPEKRRDSPLVPEAIAFMRECGLMKYTYELLHEYVDRAKGMLTEFGREHDMLTPIIDHLGLVAL